MFKVPQAFASLTILVTARSRAVSGGDFDPELLFSWSLPKSDRDDG